MFKIHEICRKKHEILMSGGGFDGNNQLALISIEFEARNRKINHFFSR